MSTWRFSVIRALFLAAVVLACSLGACGSTCRHRGGRTDSAAGSPAPGQASLPFYKSGKPYTRWWWFAAPIKEKDIAAELDWLKQNGFGGVEVAWIYPRWLYEEDGKTRLPPPPRWLSPEWSELVAYSKQYAERIGLGCDFTFGSAWPFGDSQVTEEEAARIPGESGDQQPILSHWECAELECEELGSPKQPRVFDHLNQQAFDRYAERTGKALAPALRGAPSALFCDSWEGTQMSTWTLELNENFNERFRYNIGDALMENTQEQSALNDIRYDYKRLVSDLLIDRFYRRFTETAHKLGAFARVQVAGAPVDLITAYAAVDVPETEAMLYEPPFSQIVASAAALAGRRDVTSETFTCAYGYPKYHYKEEQTADLKLIADALFANGVNQVFWHGKPFNARDNKREADFFATVHVGEQGALADELPAFNAYMEKVSATMKRGRVYSSVAVYLPTEDSWMDPVQQATTQPEMTDKWRFPPYQMRYVHQPPELKGWRPLWINHDFLERGRLEAGLLRVGEQEFSALYLDVQYLDSDTLDAILGLARAGLPVCLKRSPQQPGRNKSPTFAARVRELRALPNVAFDFAKVARGKPLVSGENLPDFWARVDGREAIIFFANPKAQNLHLPLAYGQALATEEVSRPIEITVGGKTTALTLVFPPYQSILLTMDGNGSLNLLDITFRPKTPVVTTP
jgi:hypothetical protein